MMWRIFVGGLIVFEMYYLKTIDETTFVVLLLLNTILAIADWITKSN